MQDVTSEQIGFILLLNNTIIPAVTLVLGFIAGHVDGNADDQDDWYRGFYNAETVRRLSSAPLTSFALKVGNPTFWNCYAHIGFNSIIKLLFRHDHWRLSLGCYHLE